MRLLLLIVGLLILNILAYFFYTQIDFTRDKRYSITPATTEMLRELPRPVTITLYLEGENLPAAFKRLSRSARDLLQRFEDISRRKVQYRVVDPLGSDTSHLATLSRFRMAGIPVTIDAGKKGSEQRMVFPWVLVQTTDPQGAPVSLPVFLQESNTPELSRTILLKSEVLLEYNIANAIHQLTKPKRARVAYLTGNGEAFGYQVLAAFQTISSYYTLDTVNLDQQTQIDPAYDVVIVNQPFQAFSELDKLKIDQYLLQGKSVLWCVDGATGSLDSFQQAASFNSMPLDLNLDDLFYHYGLRLNHNLLEDAVSSAGIPLTPQGPNAQPVIFPWVYFPVLQSGSEHPIVRNLNGVLGRFVSTIDTNANDPAIHKTILLASSDYSKSIPTPTPIILESAMVEKDPAAFLEKKLAAAVLLEGRFSSLFARRMPPELRFQVDSLRLKPIDEAVAAGKMIVVADGDIFMNEFSEKTGPMELGRYRYSDYRFENRAFLLNCLAYLTDPDNLLMARSKEFDSHLLDPQRVAQERGRWQLINIAVPLGCILVLGVVYYVVRKNRYG